MDMIWLA